MFEDDSYNKLLYKAGLKGSGVNFDFGRVLIALAIFWLPLVLFTLIQGTFWTGNINTSFISDFDIQARLLVSMPIFILSDRLLRSRLALILGQFVNSGIVSKEIKGSFDDIVQHNIRFLRSKWTNIAVFVVCYIQIILVFYYEYTSTSLMTWQIAEANGDAMISIAGFWATLISGPFVLFLFYRWFLRIIVWGIILFKVSRLDLVLFPVHPDLAGGLGFLGYSIRYFSIIALALSVSVAANMIDFILIEDIRLVDLRITALAYFIFITVIFALPLLSFTSKLTDAREKSIFENNDYINGIFRELKIKMSKEYEEVKPEDLLSPDFSAAADLSAVVDNALKMKFLPFTLKDLVALWVITAIPFIAVVLLEIPFSRIFAELISLLV